MNKITFIEPKAINLHIFKQFRLPRLGILILGTMMKKRGWDVDIIIEEIENINFKKLNDSSLIGISTITSTANRAYAIADKIKQMGIPVIMGGPHVTFQTEEALNHSDYIIRGEGEKALMAFIDSWETDKNLKNVPNLSYKINNQIIHNDCDDFIYDLDKIPYPDYEIVKKISPKLGHSRIIPIQTSRGCPFDCSFCSVTGMFGKKYRFRSKESIISELKQYNPKKDFIFFYDDNFTANKSRAKELLNTMINEKLKFKWSTQVRTDVAKDEELVALMKKAGCEVLYIGLESANPESLKSMKKNQTIDDIKNSIRILRKAKFFIHGMFVYGFDEDNKETIKETIKFAKKLKLTSTQFLILTPLPGSVLYENMKKKDCIIFDDWSLYDTHHVVFQPQNLSIFELQWAQIVSHTKFYSFFSIIKNLFRAKWLAAAIVYYARSLNKIWKKKNKTFLKVIELLKPQKLVEIKINYHEIIKIDDDKIKII